MKSKIQSILNRKHFFNIISINNNIVKYTLNLPSQILLKNIYVNWLKYLHMKTQKVMPVYIEKLPKTLKPPFGLIRHWLPNFTDIVFEHDINECTPKNKSKFELRIVIPKEDCMRYFMQWQRYRKYWWSSISTTPSLFAVNEIKQGESETEVDIIAKLPIGTQPVEHIEIKHLDDEKETVRTSEETSCLICKMCLEDSLFILLLDGTLHSKDEYLRLHRTITPYKISFALSFKENKAKLIDLATILYYRLKIENISVWLPEFSLSFEDQIKENLHMGITYTAILSDNTLSNGIFHLMNSSTTLKEQVHVADFHLYASLICKAK